MNFIETPFGYEIQNSKFTVFFGGCRAQLCALQELYPQYQFLRLKQIHSDAIVESSHNSPDYAQIADAQYTFEKNLALVSITADCVPVLLYDPSLQLIAAVHSGWRGVASRISQKTIQKFLSLNSKPENIQVFIGPHIQKKSFEVEYDVRDQILNSLGPLSKAEREIYSQDISEQKSLVDLHKVLMTQLSQKDILDKNIYSLFNDTVSDLRFHSHRRDRDKAGRQLNFIALNPTI